MNTYIFKVVYEMDPAFCQMSEEDSGLRSSRVRIKAESEEEALEELGNDCLDTIHSAELLEVRS